MACAGSRLYSISSSHSPAEPSGKTSRYLLLLHSSRATSGCWCSSASCAAGMSEKLSPAHLRGKYTCKTLSNRPALYHPRRITEQVQWIRTFHTGGLEKPDYDGVSISSGIGTGPLSRASRRARRRGYVSKELVTSLLVSRAFQKSHAWVSRPTVSMNT